MRMICRAQQGSGKDEASADGGACVVIYLPCCHTCGGGIAHCPGGGEHLLPSQLYYGICMTCRAPILDIRLDWVTVVLHTLLPPWGMAKHRTLPWCGVKAKTWGTRERKDNLSSPHSSARDVRTHQSGSLPPILHVLPSYSGRLARPTILKFFFQTPYAVRLLPAAKAPPVKTHQLEGLLPILHVLLPPGDASVVGASHAHGRQVSSLHGSLGYHEEPAGGRVNAPAI